MTISFPCTTCGHRFEVDGKLAGKKAKCKKCETILIIPVPHTPRQYEPPEPSKTRSSGSSPSQAAYKAVRPRETASEEPKPTRRPAKTVSQPSEEFDPYGFEDLKPFEAAKPASPYDDDGVEELPQYPRPIKAKSGKSKSKNSASSAGLPVATYLIVLVVYAVVVGLFLSGLVSFLVLVVTTILAQIGLGLVGGIGLLVTAFRESIWNGLMMFIPFYSLYYMYSRWEDCQPWGSMVCTNILISMIFNGLVGAGLARAPQAAAGQTPKASAVNAAPVSDAAAGPAPANETFQPAPHFGPTPPPVGVARPEFRPPVPGTMQPAPRFGRGGGGAASGFSSGPAVATQPPPADAVAVEISGVADQETREAFQAKFDAHRNLFAIGSSASWSFSGDLLTYKTWPIANVQDFADRIDFAKVINVAPKSIRLQANPLKDAEHRPKGPGQDLDGVIFDLKSKIVDKQKDGIRALQKMPVDDRREEVAKALEPLLLSGDIFLKADVARLLGDWGSKESAKALADTLSDPQGNVRGAALEALRKIKDPSCADAVAALLSTFERGSAADTLRAFGPEAEPAVLKYLESNDLWARTEACKVLRVIGTDAAIAPLQNLYRRVNGFGFDADAAKEALLGLNAPLTPGKGGRRTGKK